MRHGVKSTGLTDQHKVLEKLAFKKRAKEKGEERDITIKQEVESDLNHSEKEKV